MPGESALVSSAKKTAYSHWPQKEIWGRPEPPTRVISDDWMRINTVIIRQGGVGGCFLHSTAAAITY